MTRWFVECEEKKILEKDDSKGFDHHKGRDSVDSSEKEDKERSKFGRKYQKLSLCHDKFEIISGIFQLILQINYSVLHSIRCSPRQK